MNEDLKICSLCGISQIESIILNIKRYDTFAMVNDGNKNDEQKSDEQKDDIDELIASVLNDSKFNLSCPNKSHNRACKSMKRLARHLIIYKRWLQAINDDNIAKTTTVDIPASISDDLFESIFMNSARKLKMEKKITDDNIKELEKIFYDKSDNIQQVTVFMILTRKEFVKVMKKFTTINAAKSARLYKTVMTALHQHASKKQFGTYLTNLQIDSIVSDYCHILKTHINDGNTTSVDNAFRFFEEVVHHEDKETETQNCISCKRRTQRLDQRSLSNGKAKMNKKVINKNNKSNTAEDKNIWSLLQYYNQSQLDIIHAYLVHSRQNRFKSISANNPPQNKQKDNKFTSYGFGVDHSYPHLEFTYKSIHNELLYNEQNQLTENQFQNTLVKSIRKHKMALTEKNDKNKLICKYFDKNYNILRNTPIGVRHIFALIAYTDFTRFCTAYRATYRRINEKTDESVKQRHMQLYNYARALFEAIQFFGQSMSADMTVYHGLNKVMRFKKFIAYFNQPISTSPDLLSAHTFSQETGIILALKSGTKYFNDPKKVPKYLFVAWLSDFPHENENFFYGSYVVFKIHNIVQSNDLKSHEFELTMLNKFQQTLENNGGVWDDQKDDEIVKSLAQLIDHRKQEMKEDEHFGKYDSKYGRELFHYFCEHCKKIEINNFHSLPEPLYRALFYNTMKNKTEFDKLSFIPIVKTFPSIEKIALYDIDINQFQEESDDYANAVTKYITHQAKMRQGKLKEIKFQSKINVETQTKRNVVLSDLASKHSNEFKKFRWNIDYVFAGQTTHILKCKSSHEYNSSM